MRWLKRKSLYSTFSRIALLRHDADNLGRRDVQVVSKLGGTQVVARAAAIAAFGALAIGGCATYEPASGSYTGPVANLADSVIVEDRSKAQIFAVEEIDGKLIRNTFGASAERSYGRGFSLTTEVVERIVPAKPMKVRLRASHATGAPIHAIFSSAMGTYLSVDGVVDFKPSANERYVVKGELKKGASSVWIESVETGQAATEKVIEGMKKK